MKDRELDEALDVSEASPAETASGAASRSDELPNLEPMTFSLMGRLFAVPLLIIGTIVGGAVLVVLLFGAPAAPQARSVDSLLQALEASGGERSMGILLPREKELWQTALELSVRLEKKQQDAELSQADLASIARRIAGMVRTDLANLGTIPTVGVERANQQEVRSTRLQFLIRALGRTEQAEAVDPLIEIVRSGEEPFAQVAMQMLGDMHSIPEVQKGVEPIVGLLQRGAKPETRLVACTVLSLLAPHGDSAAIEALRSARLGTEGEVVWSASLALARLGSNAGKSTLLDLLDRKFLSRADLYQVTDKAGVTHRYPFPPQRVEEVMLAAIDASARLNDADLWDSIGRLQSDPSPTVRSRAIAAIERHKSASGVAEERKE